MMHWKLKRTAQSGRPACAETAEMKVAATANNVNCMLAIEGEVSV